MRLCQSATAIFLAIFLSYPTTVSAAELQKININTADVATFQHIKGVGEKRAKTIVDYRATHGKFLGVDDLASVPGIGARQIDLWRSILTN